jgi:hypothetical protein
MSYEFSELTGYGLTPLRVRYDPTRGDHFRFGFYLKNNQTEFFSKKPKSVQTDWFRFGYFRTKTETQPTDFGSIWFWFGYFILKTKNYIVFWVFFFVISNGFGFGLARFFFVRFFY